MVTDDCSGFFILKIILRAYLYIKGIYHSLKRCKIMEKYFGKISEKMKKIFMKLKDYRLLVVLGFIGMMLILISEFIPDSNKENSDIKNGYQPSEYAEYMERQVEKILGKIEGVGNVNVMLTVSGTEEYVYAQESRKSESNSSENSSSQFENSYIFEQKDGDKKALVKKVINPEITGVIVVCDGGNNSSVKEKIYEAVSVSLNVPLSRISVQAA